MPESSDQQINRKDKIAVKVILFLVDLNAVLFIPVWNYLDKHDYKPQPLNEFFGLMFVVFLIELLVRIPYLFFSTLKTAWYIVLISFSLSLISWFTVHQSLTCTFNENIPRLKYTEEKIKNGWPWYSKSCKDDLKSDLVFGIIFNSVFWCGTLLGLKSLINIKKN